MVKSLYILFLFISIAGFSQKSLDELLNTYNTRSIPYISVEGLRVLQNSENILVLDTREEEEYNVSHIENAQCVGYNNFSIEGISDKISDKNQPIIVYCSLGIRSEKIGEKLQKAGFTNVKNLYGGIFEWKNKNYSVLNRNNQQTDSIHTFSKAWGKWLEKGIPTSE